MQYENLINKLIDLGIEEDINTGDITTESIIPESMNAVATMTAKQDGVVSGLEIVKMVYERFQADTVFTPYFQNGDSVKKGDVILKVEATYPTLLRGERLSLNIFQRMCGIATETAKYVKELAGTTTELLDTRKTAPGLRVLDKMAVKDGGGTNHRMGLYDMAMIKDNHIKMAGGITKAVEQVRSRIAEGVKIEVEATCLAEVQEAVAAGADIIMFDNMTNEAMTEAAAYIKSTGKPIKTEASGNMNIPRLKEVAATGVDYISVGALTHTVKAMDISMNIQVEK
ncbi:MAG: carboxylating nicotinate-nucleotide diphosphorylase [Alistipes sp.]|nr:carboxylating nicotinate-nucleotide diphosphorylase [Alistipes sp.]MBR5812114.1 carboxylating nicotinate-nucleotide diphosphorylase [Alistipes sp.]